MFPMCFPDARCDRETDVPKKLRRLPSHPANPTPCTSMTTCRASPCAFALGASAVGFFSIASATSSGGYHLGPLPRYRSPTLAAALVCYTPRPGSGATRRA